MNRPSMYKPKAENVKKLEAFLSEIKRDIKDKELSRMVGDEHK